MVRLSPEDIAQQQVLLATHRRTLAHLMKQAAHFSAGHLPAHIASGIDEARAEIVQIKAVLRENGVTVADHVNDRPASGVLVSRLPEKERCNRLAMIEKVRLAWIEGVLKKSLLGEALIALDLAEREGAVLRPYGIARRRPDQEDTLLPIDTRIVEVFELTKGRLTHPGRTGEWQDDSAAGAGTRPPRLGYYRGWPSDPGRIQPFILGRESLAAREVARR